MRNYTFFLVLLFLVSCNDNNINNGTDNKKDENIQPIFKISSFPLNVGNWWRYRVQDFFSKSIDTILVKVVSLKNDGAHKFYFCHIELNNEIVDSAQITLSDSVISYKTFNIIGYSYFAEFYLKYPFSYGYAWHGVNQNDSLSVAPYNQDISILGKHYKTYYINRYFREYHYNHVQSIQISENIGIVRQNTSIYSYSYNQLQEFLLIDYHLE